MSDLRINKIAAGVLATGLLFWGLNLVSHSAIHAPPLDKPVYGEVPEGTGSDGGEPVELPFPQPVWVEAMNAERGAKVFKKCTSCHNADNGGAHATGPNLWNVVGGAAGSKSGFAYSGSMSTSGLTWDYETLDAYLTKPDKFLSGTNMNFVGLKKENDRAAVIEFLRVASDTPVDRPIPAATEASVEAETGDVMEAAVETLEGAPEVVEGVVTDAADAVESAATDAAGTVEDAATDAMNAVDEAVGDTKDTVEETATDIVDEAEDAVEDVIDATTDDE